MRNHTLLTLFAASLFAPPALASSLAPGGTVSTATYETNEIALGDPDWFGTSVSDTTASALETRDGFDGFGVVDDLYTVEGSVRARVTEATNGKYVFSYDFSGETGFSPGINGPIGFSLDGFAGYDVDFGYLLNDLFPYAPSISRSADGDTISVGFYDPRDVVGADLFAPSIETLMFALDADGFSLTGTGRADLVIDTFGTNTSALAPALPNPVTSAVPLPAAGWLLAGAIAGLAGLRRRRG